MGFKSFSNIRWNRLVTFRQYTRGMQWHVLSFMAFVKKGTSPGSNSWRTETGTSSPKRLKMLKNFDDFDMITMGVVVNWSGKTGVTK